VIGCLARATRTSPVHRDWRERLRTTPPFRPCAGRGALARRMSLSNDHARVRRRTRRRALPRALRYVGETSWCGSPMSAKARYLGESACRISCARFGFPLRLIHDGRVGEELRADDAEPRLAGSGCSPSPNSSSALRRSPSGGEKVVLASGELRELGVLKSFRRRVCAQPRDMQRAEPEQFSKSRTCASATSAGERAALRSRWQCSATNLGVDSKMSARPASSASAGNRARTRTPPLTALRLRTVMPKRRRRVRSAGHALGADEARARIRSRF
jgi:hypothetical protein